MSDHHAFPESTRLGPHANPNPTPTMTHDEIEAQARAWQMERQKVARLEAELATLRSQHTAAMQCVDKFAEEATELEAELASLRHQSEMDTIRFREMQDAGQRLEVELALVTRRYETLLRLNPMQFQTIWHENIAGGPPFDEIVDRISNTCLARKDTITP